MKPRPTLLILIVAAVTAPFGVASAQGPWVEPSIEQLITDLQSPDPWTRGEAAEALGGRGSSALPVVPRLANLLRDEDENVRRKAARSLGRIGTGAASGVPALAICLRDPSEYVRRAAARSLGEMGPAAVSAVDALVAALEDSDRNVRASAAVALGRIGPSADSAVPALISALDDEEVRPAAANGLGKIYGGLHSYWWVVIRVYRRECLALTVVLACWFALLARFPRHRPTRRSRRVTLIALTAALPIALTGGGAGYVLTREWVQDFLPGTLTIVSLPMAVILSIAFVSFLASVWVCQRKAPAPGSDTLPLPGTPS